MLTAFASPTTNRATPACAAMPGPIGHRRIRWYREAAAIALFYGAYLLIRGFVTVDISSAISRGNDILRLQEQFGLALEAPLNEALSAWPVVGLASAYLYATLHYVVTPLVLLGTVGRPDAYRLARNSLAMATALGLIGYVLLPTAPPRLLETGFTDTMAQWSSAGWWGEAASAPEGLEAFSNQYAAMPSLHVGWAVWVALVLDRPSRRLLSRFLIWSYPVVMAFVVMATANHYLCDAIAGTVCALLGHWAATMLRLRSPRSMHLRTSAVAAALPPQAGQDRNGGDSEPLHLSPQRPR